MVEKGKWKNEDFSLFVGKMQSGMEPRGGSACQGSGLVLHLVETSLLLHILQQFLPHCVPRHRIRCLHCNSESFPFTASCFLSFGEVLGWELLEMCVTKFDLFIIFF